VAGYYNLRQAVPNDAIVLSALALRSKSYWGYSDDFIRSCEAELTVQSSDITDDRTAYVVAEYNAEIVGFFALEKTSDAQFELTALFVEPEHISNGVGRMLLQHAIQDVDLKGGKTLLIQGDPNAEAFYLAAGAQHVGTRESGSIPGRLLPLFEIEISDSQGAIA
jgi:N-acetylglutamate synthase-like GNAT family acetyltransferase